MRLTPHRLSWIAPVAILALATMLRVWALDRPHSLVFDELYYVRDAVSQLAHGYPTAWPDNDPAFGGERARAFLDQANAIAHPPLGKWLIGLGILLCGPDTGWGWRLSVALAGVATVGVTMRLGWVLSRSIWVACLAGLLLTFDGVHLVLSRVSLLDGFLTFFVALGALCVAHDWRAIAGRRGKRLLWQRPWLLAAGLVFGAAAAVKWSGLYPLAAFLVFVTIADLVRRTGAIWRTLAQAAVTAAIVLPAALISYLASWIGWIISPNGQNRHDGEPWWESLWQWHTDAFSWHATLAAPHPYQSSPLGWPLALKPTAMFDERWDGYIAAITPLPNPLVTLGGVLALLILTWLLLRRGVAALRTSRLAPLRGRAVAVSAFVLTGYLSGWLPWVVTVSRPAVFQFYSVVMTPFAALALALVLAGFAALPRCGWVFSWSSMPPMPEPGALRGRRIAVAIYLVATAVLGVLFWPLWIGMPVESWFYRAHLWLPGWA